MIDKNVFNLGESEMLFKLMSLCLPNYLIFVEVFNNKVYKKVQWSDINWDFSDFYCV